MKHSGKMVYVAVIILSVLFLFVGNRVVTGDTQDICSYCDSDIDPYSDYDCEYCDINDISFYIGVITQIVDRVEEDQFGFTNITTYFEARITSGERRGDIIAGEQHQSDFFLVTIRDIAVGDRVVLVHDAFGQRYFFDDFARINVIAILGVIFLVLVIVFGRVKGFSAIVALGFTCMAVFLVFIPAILSGYNIYIATMIVCLFAIVSTLLIVIGPNKKALSAMLGCLGGVLLAGLLMFMMDKILGLTGLLDMEAQSLLLLDNPVDLRAIIFAGVILGAVGAIMDVAMSIASSLWEVKEVGGDSDFGSIVKSGINIGKDILGTMLNTLILAYIGSSLSIILLLNVHSASYIELLNREMIIVEFLRPIVGSFGMFLTLPLTAAICAALYTRQAKDASPPQNNPQPQE